MPKIAFATVGCKLNQYETQVLQARFARAGFEVVPFKELADVYVVNSCTVTHKSAADSRKLARRAHRLNPQALVVLCGCYAQLEPEAAAAVEGVGLVAGCDGRAGLVEAVQSVLAGAAPPAPLVSPAGDVPLLCGLEAFPQRRAFLKIQEGCDYACAYCAVKLARGPSRFRPEAEILAEAESLVANGASELVLVGVNIGDYGNNRPGRNLAALTRRILALGEGFRVRFSSIEPQYMTGELFELVGFEPRICSHLHLPLQTGDEVLLQRMGRPYSSALFAKLVSIAKFNDLHCGLGTDVICGLPGETEEAFEATRRLVEALPFTYGHVFSYSPRPGTRAAQWKDDVPPQEKRRRTNSLRELFAAKHSEFLARQVGRTLEVVPEQQVAPGLWQGTSDNYLKVRFTSASPPPGLAKVTITGASTDSLEGEF